MSLFSELKRRNVFKVTAAYLLVAWLLLQISENLAPALHLPPWFHSGVAFLLILGLPVAVLLAWAYELTPGGLRREGQGEGETGPGTASGRKQNAVLLAVVVVVVGYFAYDQFLGGVESEAPVRVDGGGGSPPGEEPVAAPRKVLPNSVAVLPLDNLSDNPSDAYFAAGIHDELLNQLAKIRDLNVIARTSVLRYAERGAMTIPEIAAELNVSAVMEGTVRYAGDRVRITAQLIDGDTDTHLWSQTYEARFDAENIFAIESDMAMQIAAALEAKLLPSEKASIERPPTTSTEALTLYLKAKARITDIGPFMPDEEVADFHRYLDQALAVDPGFALAHAWKAYEYGFSITRTYPLANENTTARRTALVRQHAGKALELDPDLGVAHAAMAWPDVFALRREKALDGWERAYALSPGDPDIVTDFAFVAAALGQTERALDLARQGLEIGPNSAQVVAVVALPFAVAGDLAEVKRLERRAMSINPGFFFPYLMLGLAQGTTGDVAEAQENLRIAEEMSRGIPSADILSMLTYGYGRIGQREDAMRIFAQIEGMATESYVGPASWALACLGVEKEVCALEHLREVGVTTGAGEGILALTLLAANAFGDPVLDRPEFAEARRALPNKGL